ncbi:MAG: TOBE domain-containing protein [Hyphomicrobium sp.]|nr:TOBE domain-containing protein [Hyphomicrobium sp.]
MTIGSALRGSCSTGVLSALAAAAAGSLAGAYPAAAETASEFQFQTLDYGPEGTFLTGIRGDNIVGNYTIPGTTETGGLYYNLASGAWSPMPLATPNGANFPGAIGSSPYGPSFGHPGGVLRVVGTYQTETSAPYDLSYLYDGAGGAKGSITPLAYPGEDTLYTVAHSTFGNTVVGDYDTRLATGNAFIYDIDAGTYTTNNIPGAASTTAYGVYGDKIAGGYAMALPGGGLGPEHGYIYDRAAGTYETHDHPGAVATHFEGITGAGRSDEYNLVANWITADGAVHPAVMHIDALGKTTWYEIDIPGAVVSSNSAYGEHVVGVYVAGGMVKGYLATLPGIYNPIRNTGTLTSAVVNGAALSGGKGDDIVNSGSVQVTGEGGIGMRGETYGVLTNSGTVTATGLVGAAAEMHGLYGTLLNSGTLQTAFVADFLGRSNFLTGDVTEAGVFTARDGTRLAFRSGWQVPNTKALLAFRPEKVTISPNGSAGEAANALPGHIVDTLYSGSSTEVSVRLASGETIVVTRQNSEARRGDLTPGHAVTITWPSEATVVVSDTSE